jgi:hypothetical protein
VTIDAERVRRAAADALEPFGDERALHLLASADIAIEEEGMEWEGSVGAMRAHRVLLGVDGAALAHALTVPAVRDALESALAGALAAEPGHALSEVRAYWGLRPPASVTYRAAQRRPASVDDPEHVREAACAYLEAVGNAAAAALLETLPLTVSRTPRAVVLRGLAADERRRAIDVALRAVLLRPDGEAARVVWL